MLPLLEAKKKVKKPRSKKTGGRVSIKGRCDAEAASPSAAAAAAAAFPSLSEVDVQLWEAVISNNLAGAIAVLPDAGTGVDVDARDYDGW